MELVHADDYTESRAISVHPRRVDLQRAREERDYSRHFREGFRAAARSISELAATIKTEAWSPILWSGGHAKGSNYLRCGWMALDFDTPAYSLEEALRDWCDSVHIIGISKSHQRPKMDKVTGAIVVCDRFRIIVPWAHEITDFSTYRFNIKTLIDRYGADKSCKDGARFFFPCPKVVSLNRCGYLQPVLAAPPVVATIPPERYRKFGMVRRRTVEALRGHFRDGEKNDTCFTVAKDLYDAGYNAVEIFTAILNSPTYGGRVSPDLAEEINRCIANGIHSVKEGLAYGGREGSGRGAEKTPEKDGEGPSI